MNKRLIPILTLIGVIFFIASCSRESPLMVAQYNSPWALPPFRKNELLYTIK